MHARNDRAVAARSMVVPMRDPRNGGGGSAGVPAYAAVRNILCNKAGD